jgi:ubiquitin C-terminal hydrolase
MRRVTFQPFVGLRNSGKCCFVNTVILMMGVAIGFLGTSMAVCPMMSLMILRLKGRSNPENSTEVLK